MQLTELTRTRIACSFIFHRLSEADIALKLGLDAKDVNQMCTKLRNHGLLQSEESKAQAAIEETSVIAEVLKQAGLVSSSHGISSSSSTLGYRGYQAAKQVRSGVACDDRLCQCVCAVFIS